MSPWLTFLLGLAATPVGVVVLFAVPSGDRVFRHVCERPSLRVKGAWVVTAHWHRVPRAVPSWAAARWHRWVLLPRCYRNGHRPRTRSLALVA